ncbi:MAG: hypothetical protein IT572_04015 [Deltaproteobacteria bacterium]|nr:hypothetical protein [Deltaproteobacteria bacterium]
MRELERVSQELQALQSQLQGAANRLWKLKFSLNSAFHHGYSERDFLPRRLLTLRRQEQERFEALLQRLKRLLSSELGRPVLVLDSEHDLDTLRRIRRTICYLKNAYCAEPPLLHALARLSRAIPSRSVH